MRLLNIYDVMKVYDDVCATHDSLYPSDEDIESVHESGGDEDDLYKDMDKAITDIYVKFINYIADGADTGVTLHLILTSLSKIKEMYQTLGKECERCMNNLPNDLYIQTIRATFAGALNVYLVAVERCDWLTDQLTQQYSFELEDEGIVVKN